MRTKQEIEDRLIQCKAIISQTEERLRGCYKFTFENESYGNELIHIHREYLDRYQGIASSLEWMLGINDILLPPA